MVGLVVGRGAIGAGPNSGGALVTAAVGLLPATLLSANLSALRCRRDGTDELFVSTPSSREHRTAAHLLSVLAGPCVIALVLGAGVFFLRLDGRLIIAYESSLPLQAVVVAAAFGAFGVALARWIPSVLAAPVVIVAHVTTPLIWVVPWVLIRESGGIIGWHVAYLLGITTFFAAVGFVRDRPRPARITVAAIALPVTLRPPCSRSRRAAGRRTARPLPCDNQGMKASTRLRRAGLLVPPMVRTIRWSALCAVAPTGVLLLYAGKHSAEGVGELHLYAAGLLLGVWTGFLIDDPAAEITAGMPFQLLARRAVRIGVALPVVWAVWGSLAAYAGLGPRTGPLSVAFASQLAVSLGLASMGAHVAGRERGGLLAAAGLFVVFFVVPLAFRLTLSVDPGQTWALLYGRWIAVAAIAGFVFLAASVDPARPRPLRIKLSLARSPKAVQEAR